MKHLTWLTMFVVVSSSGGLVACSDDVEPMGSAGGTSSAGQGVGGSSSGATAAGQGGSSSVSGSPAGGTGVNAGGMGGGGAGGSVQTAQKDIIDTAVAAGTFTKLAAALTQAGLVEALKGPGPFTVFAPDDAAFDAFEAANPGVLAGLSKEQLTGILTYHVVSGAAVKSAALLDEQVFTTLSGSPVLVDLTGGAKVASAAVKTPDVEASNGVIHVIDKIILPPEKDIVDTAVAAGGFTQLAGALTSANLVDTLKGPGPFTVFAPTDAAFAKLPAVPAGDALKDVLLYHVVSGAVGSGDLKAGAAPTLLQNKSVTVDLTGGVKIDDANVATANIIAKNGVIHVIDTVLVPE